MIRPRLLKMSGAVLFGLAIFGLSNDRGSANGDPEDRKLEAFIEAASAVDGVMATWQPRIVGAEDHEAEALRQQANIAIRESIENVEGISFAEYRNLRQAIAVDPKTRARVTEIMLKRHQP
ncbi:MAG: hypothetical protein OEU92_22560 [Alphaproteobacteria bacterium]|nr:hypothetical protein [Alphaproteobacteria bacterium]